MESDGIMEQASKKAVMPTYSNLTVELIEEMLTDICSKKGKNEIYVYPGIARKVDELMLKAMREAVDEDAKNNNNATEIIKKIDDKNNKYYTPSIEEFHVGFEYEYKSAFDELITDGDGEDGWYRHVFNPKGYISLKKFKENISQNKIRVKYLDKEDIESFGFKYKDRYRDGGSCVYAYKCWNLIFYKTNTVSYGKKYIKDTIAIKYFHPDDSKGELHFFGTIKNKSELKKVLKMIGVL